MIREILKKLVFKEKASSASYIEFLRAKGAKIGERVEIYEPRLTLIDSTRPWLISIGNDVKITRGVTILTHGYDWSVLQGVYGDVLGSSGGVEIGNNVFIGMHSTILKNTTIGDNVIIGANSLVNKDVPSNVVVAGNPCRVIMGIEDYHKKRIEAQEREAKELVIKYYERFHKRPTDYELREFFWLFANRQKELTENWKNMMELSGEEEKCYQMLEQHSTAYNNMDEFIDSALKN